MSIWNSIFVDSDNVDDVVAPSLIFASLVQSSITCRNKSKFQMKLHHRHSAIYYVVHFSTSSNLLFAWTPYARQPSSHFPLTDIMEKSTEYHIVHTCGFSDGKKCTRTTFIAIKSVFIVPHSSHMWEEETARKNGYAEKIAIFAHVQQRTKRSCSAFQYVYHRNPLLSHTLVYHIKRHNRW